VTEQAHPDFIRARADLARQDAAEVVREASQEALQRRQGVHIIGRIGTRAGRILEVVHWPGPRVVQLRDPSVPHRGGVLAELNTDQAGELIDALTKAVNRE
jgi:hypothetical protein